ncbi:MAG: MucR family transcriptional regulator [Candidatus Symbiobacter sp.]|nr:MucR family transcriptional regulator [Candidatus Symbiobacter sp.]
MSQDQSEKSLPQSELLRMTTDVVSAFVARNDLNPEQIPGVIQTVFTSLRNVEGGAIDVKMEPLKPAVSVRKSVQPDYIICLEDGKRLKMLKRHLRTMYNMSPEDYRAKWGLPSDYPMVAPNYAQQRSDFAKQIGLGRGAKEDGQKPGRRRRA